MLEEILGLDGWEIARRLILDHPDTFDGVRRRIERDFGLDDIGNDEAIRALPVDRFREFKARNIDAIKDFLHRVGSRTCKIFCANRHRPLGELVAVLAEFLDEALFGAGFTLAWFYIKQELDKECKCPPTPL